MHKRLSLALFLSCVFALSGALHAQDDTFNVLATTTIIADVAQNVGGDLITVSSLIPPDTDLHAFQPTPAEAAAAAEADLVLVNGAGLEAFLGDLLQGTGDDGRIVVVSNGVPMLAGGHDDADEHDDDHAAESTAEATHEAETHHDAHVADHASAATIGILGEDADCGDVLADHDHEATEEAHADETHDEDAHEEHGPCDPHVWTDPTNVKIWADNIAAAFAALDPAHADTYRANADTYKAALDALDAEVTQILSVIPSERRILVTNHEFLAYFAARYDFEIVGTVMPGISTLAEPAPQELAALIETIRAESVPAIFIEVSDAGTLANVVAAEVGSEINVVTLYSDSLSTSDSPASTYLGYLRSNAETIAAALQG